MSAARRLRRRAGLTLVEIVISSAVLAVMALALLMVTIPLTRSSSDTTVALDMDTRARIFFAALRPELRQSGFGNPATVDPAGGGVFCFPLFITNTNTGTNPPTYTSGSSTIQGAMYSLADTAIDADTLFDQLTYRKRKAPASGQPAGDADWSNKFVITLEDIAGRLAICRQEFSTLNVAVGGKSVLQSGDIAALEFTDGDGVGPPATVPGSNGDGSIGVILTLERKNPNYGQGADEPVMLRRVYAERIQLMNRR